MSVLYALISIDKEYIPLRYIETLNFDGAFDIPVTPNLTASALRGGPLVRIRTLSGFEYVCSLTENLDILSKEAPGQYPADTESFWRIHVLPSWMYYVKNN